MATNMDTWQTLRKTWVKARDSAKPTVAKGAVKGVSVGGDIDAVYKGSLKGYQPLHDALAKLVKDIDTYQLKIKGKNANLVTWTDTNIEKPAKALLDDMQSDDALLKQLLKDTDQRLPSFPDALNQVMVNVLEAKKPLKDAAPDVYKSLRECRDFCVGIAQAYKGAAAKVSVSLAANDRKAALESGAADVAHNARLINNLLKAFATVDGKAIAENIKFSRGTDFSLDLAMGKVRKVVSGSLLT